tara:strand:- start:197 stop:376 length:180 start_codon:yes stop_codon:yes gene_type:complete
VWQEGEEEEDAKKLPDNYTAYISERGLYTGWMRLMFFFKLTFLFWVGFAALAMAVYVLS